MSQFSIGPFTFISLSRPPSGPKRRLVREARPGSEGVSFWGVGQQTGPFAATSVRDCQNCLAAANLLLSYQTLVGGNPLELYWSGTLHSLVIVHDVEPLDEGVTQTLLAVGGELGTSEGLLRCQWLLEMVQFVEE